MCALAPESFYFYFLCDCQLTLWMPYRFLTAQCQKGNSGALIGEESPPLRFSSWKKKRTGRLFSSTFGSIIVQLVGVITNTIREQRERESEAKKEIGNRIAAGGWRISYTSKFIRRYCWMIEMRNSWNRHHGFLANIDIECYIFGPRY